MRMRLWFEDTAREEEYFRSLGGRDEGRPSDEDEDEDDGSAGDGGGNGAGESGGEPIEEVDPPYDERFGWLMRFVRRSEVGKKSRYRVYVQDVADIDNTVDKLYNGVEFALIYNPQIAILEFIQIVGRLRIFFDIGIQCYVIFEGPHHRIGEYVTLGEAVGAAVQLQVDPSGDGPGRR